ncbi:hypothetical protein EV175_006416, partial [Coemansia sp. RSA 1933]
QEAHANSDDISLSELRALKGVISSGSLLLKQLTEEENDVYAPNMSELDALSDTSRTRLAKKNAAANSLAVQLEQAHKLVAHAKTNTESQRNSRDTAKEMISFEEASAKELSIERKLETAEQELTAA